MATRREIIQKLDELEPAIARAFREAVQDIRSRARLNELAAALDANDLDRAVRAAGLRQAGWTQLTEAIRQSFLEGGLMTAASAPASIGFTFDMRNPRAAAWLREQSSRLVTQINTEQRQAVRVALQAGMEQGRNPRRTALDIVGRIDRRSGRRVGGVVGLTSEQAQYVENARRELREGSVSYFTRKRRDRRFDSLVKKAFKSGAGLSAEDVDRITARYSDRLLKLRGNNIGRTEATASFNAGRQEGLNQAVEQGLVRTESVRRIWDAFRDGRQRASHSAAETYSRNNRVGPNEPFPVGAASLMYPGDPSGPARETVNCRCFLMEKVDWVQNAVAA